MAERPGVESVLTRLDDMAGRLATAKNLSDVQEAIGRCATTKQLIEIQESQTKIVADQKGLRTELAEFRESMDKAFRKLREEVIEAVESAPGGDAEETTEAIEKTVEKYVGEAKGLFKWLVGDDPDTVAALRGRVRDWVGKKGKKALTGGSDE